MLFIKSRQIASTDHIYWSLMLMLDSNSTEAVSIKNYEIQISRFDFTHIHVHLCRVSFLTTLDIYKDYFKGHQMWYKVMQLDEKSLCSKLWSLETKFALVHHILSRNYCVFAPRVLWPRSFLIFIVRWTEKLCSQYLPQVGVLVTYWDLCIIGYSCTGNCALKWEIATTLQIQLIIGIRVQL